jgi:hypothetical protein
VTVVRLRSLLVGSLVGGLVLLTACAGDDDPTTGTEAPAVTAPPTPPPTTVAPLEGVLRIRPVIARLPIDGMQLNPFGDDAPTGTMVSPDRDSLIAYDLGPAVVTEDDVLSATAEMVQGEWSVLLEITPEAATRLDATAALCLALDPSCESGYLAITVDGFVVSAATVIDPAIGTSVTITGGFTQPEADEIAAAISATISGTTGG